MLRSLQNLIRAPVVSSQGILGPAMKSLAQKSFCSSWFNDDQLKLDKVSEKKKNRISPAEKYDPYPNYDFHTPSPYRDDRGIRKFYVNRCFTSGVLPRPEGKWENIPVPKPVFDPIKMDVWKKKKALFGQNDYIDILGDGTIHPWELTNAPIWLKGFSGNEYQRLVRRMAMQGEYLKEIEPTRYHQIQKHIRFLFKKLNRRRKSSKFGEYRRYSRIDKPKDR